MYQASIVVQNLSKQFQNSQKLAVSNLNLEIQPGESVAFLGANGAGKSTTIKMLCGIITPTTGNALITGYRAGSLEANRQLGMVFGTRSQLYLHMTVYQCFDLIAEIYYLSGVTKKKRIDELIQLFDLKELVQRRVRTLSLGQRMRCEVVAALIHEPKILLADEPTIGLDIIAKNQLRSLIQKWQKEKNTTLMLTSHDLSDVQTLCQRCIVIDQGQKVFDGTFDVLKGDLANVRRIQVTLAEEMARLPQQSHLLPIFNSEPYIHTYECITQFLPMSQALFQLCQHYGNMLQDIAIFEVQLEEILSKWFTKKNDE